MQRILKTTIAKFTLATLLIVIPAGFLLSFKAKGLYADIWQQLGITKEKGTDNIKESFLSGWFHYYGVRNIKSVVTGDKAAIAKDLALYAKQFVSSESFKKEYELQRKNAKPTEPVNNVRAKEEIRKEKITETEKSIKEIEEAMKKPEMAKLFAPALDMLKKSLKDYQDPKSEMIELFYQSEKMGAEQNTKSYQDNLKRWETEYPADYRQLVKVRLQKFIDLAKTVNFSAELKDVNGKKKFVNPAYEGKPYDWKQIYRAGKEVIEPTVSFAEQWIKELN
jgi:hypothetical protein